MTLHKNIQRFPLACLGAGALLCLAACGGGGNDVDPASRHYPAAAPAAGDYFVYQNTTTPTLPTTEKPSDTAVTHTYAVVNADGSMSRVDTASGANDTSSTRHYAADGSLTGIDYASGQTCSFTAGRFTAPTQSTAGDSYHSTATESCTVGGNTTTTQVAVSGQAAPLERIDLPVGTFTAFKYSQTTTYSSATEVTTARETCWTDMTTARNVLCTGTYATVPVGQTQPTRSGSTRFELKGYSFHGQTDNGGGGALQRFAGKWNVALTGGSTGSCAGLAVGTDGKVAGRCELLAADGLASVPFNVSGTVDATGVASIQSNETGEALTGNFASPATAAGTWTQKNRAGHWTATHR